MILVAVRFVRRWFFISTQLQSIKEKPTKKEKVEEWRVSMALHRKNTKIMICLSELGRLGSRRAFRMLPYCAQGLPSPLVLRKAIISITKPLHYLQNSTVCASAERKLNKSKGLSRGLCKKSETGEKCVVCLETRGRRIRELFAKTLLETLRPNSSN